MVVKVNRIIKSTSVQGTEKLLFPHKDCNHCRSNNPKTESPNGRLPHITVYVEIVVCFFTGHQIVGYGIFYHIIKVLGSDIIMGNVLTQGRKQCHKNTQNNS